MPECQRSFQGRTLPSRSDIFPPKVCRSGSTAGTSRVRNDRFPACGCGLCGTPRPFWVASLLLIWLSDSGLEKYRRLSCGSNSFSIPVMWWPSSQSCVRPVRRFGLDFGKPWRSNIGGRKGGLSRSGWLGELRLPLRRLGADLDLASSRACPCTSSGSAPNRNEGCFTQPLLLLLLLPL